MEIVKWPETQMEYYELIEGLGGMGWRLNHDLADGRIKDSSGGVAKDISDIVDISTKLVLELEEKFGVIPPQKTPNWARYDILASGGELPLEAVIPPPPPGKIWYKDWYQMMKNVWNDYDYRTMVCYACPFGKHDGHLNCSIYSGYWNFMIDKTECEMMRSYEDFDYEELYTKIEEESGKYEVEKFKVHQKQLKKKEEKREEIIVKED